jgi:hypothetical protein
LKTFSMELRLFKIIFRYMKVFTIMWDILKDLRLFKFIFNKVESSDYKCEAFVKIKRFLKDIFRKVEVFFKFI